MNHSLKLAGALATLVVAAGCAEGDPEPTPTVTVTATETATVTPEPEAAPQAESAAGPEDEWLDEIWDQHVDGIIDWWTEYHHVDNCTPERQACYDSFDTGYELMDDYKEAITQDDPHRPSYVDSEYRSEVALAVLEFSWWRLECLAGTDACHDQAGVAHDSVEDVMNEALGWYEIEDGYRVTD